MFGKGRPGTNPDLHEQLSAFPNCDRLAARYRQLEAAIRFHGGTKDGCRPGNRTRSFVVMSHAAYQLPCLRYLDEEQAHFSNAPSVNFRQRPGECSLLEVRN